VNARVREGPERAAARPGRRQAAIAAVTCRLSPGERNGQAVPVRIRGDKGRFLMQDAS
jgi:hypothetical protein